MFKRHILFFLEDMTKAIDNIFEYTKGYEYEDFLKDKKTTDAVLRNFSIIGEASNKIPEEIQNKKQNIDWPAIIGLRNRIIHGYFGIDYNIVWFIIQNELEPLKIKIIQLITDLKASEK